MNAYWTPKDSEEYFDHEADVLCFVVGGQINFQFMGRHDSQFQARVSLKITNEIQVARGFWLYPNPKRGQLAEDTCDARVEGKLTIVGKNVAFTGIWDDSKCDGSVYEFELDASIG